MHPAQVSFARAFSQWGEPAPTPDKYLHNSHVQMRIELRGKATCEYCGEAAMFDGMCPTCIGDIYSA